MATNKNFIVKNGLEVGGQEVISSSGVVTSTALGGQTLGTTDSPTFANTTLTGSLRGPATFTIDPAAVGDNSGTLVIAGNLQVDGTTTTINSTTMEVDDLNITLASGAANAAAANGAGITVDGASATITYDSTNDEWDFNKDINVSSRVLVGEVKASANQTFTHGTGSTVNFRNSSAVSRLFIDSAGNVGIGTTSPSHELEIHSASPTVEWSDSDNNYRSQITQSGSAFYFDSDIGAGGSSSMRFRINGNSEAMRISSGGNVGIQNDNPAAPLDVAGNFIFKSPANTLYGNFDTTTAAYGAFRLQNQGSNYGFIGQTSSLLASGGSNTALGLRSENEFVIATGGSTERMRIDSEGNFLIGKTTHNVNNTAGVDITTEGAVVATNDGGVSFLGNRTSSDGIIILLRKDNTTTGSIGTSGTSMTFGTGTNGAEKMRIDSSGNVGIGTTDIDAVLHVKDDAAANDNFDVLIEGFRPNLVFEDISTSATDFQLFVDSNRLDFLYGDASTDTKLANIAMSIDNSGNVEFANNIRFTNDKFIYSYNGGTSGQVRSGVKFDGTNQSLDFYTAQNERVMIDSSGNVGIGTNSPDHDLHIETTDPTLILAQSGSLNSANSGRILFAESPSYTTNNAHFEIKYDGAENHLYFGSPLDGSTNLFVVGRDGKVGIGTISPGRDMVLKSEGSTNGFRIESNDDNLHFLGAGASSGTGTDDGYYAQYSQGILKTQIWANGISYFNGGDVGIGTTSASARLHLHDTVEEVLRIDSGDTGAIHFFEDSTRRGIIGYSNGGSIFSNAGAGDIAIRAESGKNIHLGISGTSYATVNSSGLTALSLELTDSSKMGFGATTAGASVGHTASINEGIFWHSANDAYAIFRTAGAWSGDYSQLRLNWTTGIIIDGGSAYGKSGTRIIGDLICGTGTGYPHSASINSAYFHATGDTSQPACRLVQVSSSNSYPVVRMRHESTTSGRYIEFRTDENVLTGLIQDVSGTMQYQSSSDSRLKENVEPMAEGLTEVLAMNPVKFTWKDIVTENKTVNMESAESRGFLAQELNEEYPWAVYEGGEDEKDDPWSVDYGKLTPILVKAIQELKEELDAAKARITELEG